MERLYRITRCDVATAVCIPSGINFPAHTALIMYVSDSVLTNQPLFLEKLEEFLDYFEPKIDEHNDLLPFNHIFVKRTANLGAASKQQRIRYAHSGPAIRGRRTTISPRSKRRRSARRSA